MEMFIQQMMSWQRKALSCGLHLFPVPSDPFALPYSYISDPLRGPILIPLNVACLSSSGEPFAQFTSSTWGRRMHLFQVRPLSLKSDTKGQGNFAELIMETARKVVNVSSGQKEGIQRNFLLE